MTRAEANAQVEAIMEALETGINERSPEKSLAGFYKGDADWLAEQRRWVERVIERLDGHRGELRYHPSYWAHFEAGSYEVVSKSVYGGPAIVLDRETGEVVGEMQRHAVARTGRFLMHPPPAQDSLRRMSGRSWEPPLHWSCCCGETTCTHRPSSRTRTR